MSLRFSTLRLPLLVKILVASGVAGAGFGLAQIWLHPVSWDNFLRAEGTIAVLGALSGFLIAVDYDLPGSRAKALLAALVMLAMTLGALTIGQIWWSILDGKVFGKIALSVVVLTGLVSFLLAVSEDFSQNKKLRDDNYID